MWVLIDEANHLWKCEKNGALQRSLRKPFWACDERKIEAAPPMHGPGTVLRDLIRTYLRSSESVGCECDEWVTLMNAWGSERCLLPENKAAIVQRLQAAAKKYAWNLDRWWARWGAAISSLTLFKSLQYKSFEYLVEYAANKSAELNKKEIEDGVFAHH